MEDERRGFNRRRAESSAQAKRIRARPGKPRGRFGRALTARFAICGVIMLAVLIMSAVNTEATRAIKRGISSVISKNITMKDVSDAAGASFNGIAFFADGVKTIFGFEKDAAPDEDEAAPAYAETDSPSSEIEVEIGEALSEKSDEEKIYDDDFRIDEDILDAINNREDAYLKENGG